MLKSKTIIGKEKKSSNSEDNAFLELAKERKALTFIANNTNAYVWCVDANFSFTFYNDALRDELAISLETAYETSFLSVLVENTQQQFKNKIKEEFLSRKSKSFEFPICFKFNTRKLTLNCKIYIQKTENKLFDGLVFIAKPHDETQENPAISKENMANALEQVENKYKTLVANIPSVSYRCRVLEGWIIDYVSDEIENLSGYSPSDFNNNSIRAISEIIHPDDQQMVEELILGSLYNKNGYKLEYRIIHKNGTIKWVLERGRASLNDKNEVEWLSGVISDITNNVLVRENLKKSEEKFRQIFEQSNSVISIQTKNKILLVNKAWEKIMGYSSIEASKLNPFSIIHSQIKEEFTQKINNALNEIDFENNFVLYIVDKERNEKWIDASISLIDYEDQKAILLIGTDVTTRKKAEIELNKLSTGIMNSPSSIVITDIDGNIEYVNPFFCESTGYTQDEVLGKNPKILQSGGTPQEVYTNLWGTILAGNVWYGEFENRKKNGEKYWERARIAPIKDENNIIISFIAIKEDVTEQKRYHEMIEQSEKDLRALNAKKDKFFSIIAHDLRSPFVGLVGLTDLLNTNYNELSEEKIKYYLKFANESAHNVFRLLETLLEWAKSQTGRMEFRLESIDIAELIQDAIGIARLSAQGKDITLVNYAFKSVKINADKNMIFTILRNLISNAIKYTPRNGKVSVDVKEDDRNLVVSITDNGVGIPKDKQNKLFKIEVNYSTIGTDKEKGSGLGLLLCKEFIEKHGGKIWCQSEENKGSTFSFSIPKRSLN